MDKKIKMFMKIRKELLKELSTSLQVYYCDIWDPCCEFIVQKEVYKIVKFLMENKYSDIDKDIFPQFIFRRSEESDKHMDVLIQEYYNNEPKLKYLGSPVIDDHIHDVYIRPSFFMGDYRLFVKYGHDEDHYVDGGEQAEMEYYNGIRSPLSIAYQLALDAGEV
jgi:hypothetical protein